MVNMIMSGDRIYTPSLYFYRFELKNEGKPLETQQIYQHGEKLLNQFKSPPQTPQNNSETTQENPNIMRFFYEMTPQKSPSRFAHKIKIREKDYPVWGYANYQEIERGYGLWFNLHIPEREAGSGKLLEVPLEIFRYFSQTYPLIIDNKNKNYTNNNENFIGQTLLVTSLLTPEQRLKAKTDRKYLKSLSDRILSELLNATEMKPLFKGEDTLLGSPVFAYSLVSSKVATLQPATLQPATIDPATRSPAVVPHVLIWFLLEREAEQVYQNYQEDFFQLFYCSHQVVAAWVESAPLHDLLSQIYSDIQYQFKQVDKFSAGGVSVQVLEFLRGQLRDFSKLALEYSELMRKLEVLQETITFSCDRYQQILQRIIAEVKDEASVSFLGRLIQEDAKICQKKIQGYISEFRTGQFLLEQANYAVRSLIDLAVVNCQKRLDIQSFFAGVFAGFFLTLLLSIGAFLIVSRYLGKF
jgi:hypothetical protein